MKAIFITLVFALLCNTSFFAQNYASGMFTFCKQKGETITLEDLKKCPELVSKNKKLDVQSYTIAIYCLIPESDRDSLKEIFADITGAYLEYKIAGSKLTQEVFNYFDKHRGTHLKIIIDDVVAIEKGAEGKYEGFVFYLH